MGGIIVCVFSRQSAVGSRQDALLVTVGVFSNSQRNPKVELNGEYPNWMGKKNVVDLPSASSRLLERTPTTTILCVAQGLENKPETVWMQLRSIVLREERI
jgi:hypothetical protein